MVGMASLFILRAAKPPTAAQCRELGAVKGAWMPDAVSNQPGSRAVVKVPAAARSQFQERACTAGQFEELTIDAEVGLGGEDKLTGSAMMMCRLVLACPYDDFKVTFVQSIAQLYPGLCKAYLGRLPEKNGDERAFYCVFFDKAALFDVKLSHDLSKPSEFSKLLDDGVVKEVEVLSVEHHTDVLGYGDINAPPPKKLHFDWVPEVTSSFDENNRSGARNHVEMWGRINCELTAKLQAACDFLDKHQHTFSFSIQYVIESDLEIVVRERCTSLPGKAKDHLRLHAGGPLVILNSDYLGSIREFEGWAASTYGYADKTMDALYAKRARKSLAMYMEREKDAKDFVFLDLAVKQPDGSALALKPRIVIELYKKLLPKASFNMLTTCEDKLRNTTVHRVVPKGWVQMGSSLAGGDVSVFGGTFEDESFAVKHTGAGDVGMASAGVHANASQFYISLDKLDWLDGKKVVFGRVVDGLKAVKAIGRAEVAPWNQRPKQVHYVAQSGKLTPAMALDKRTALHGGVDGDPTSSKAVAGSEAAPQVMSIGDEPTAAATADGTMAAAEGAAQTATGAAETKEEEVEIFDVNSYDDDAHKAALKMQQAGRGMLSRKHAKKVLEFKFSQTVADQTPAALWAVLGEFEGSGLLKGGWYEKVPSAEEPKIGAKRTVVPCKGWWCETARDETLVTRNVNKLWLSYALVGPKEILDKAKYTDCTVTWKIRAEGDSGSVVVCVVKMLPKKNPDGGADYTEEQLSPSFKTEFEGMLEAALKVVQGAETGAETPALEAPAAPGDEATGADAPAEGDVQAAPAADAAAEGEAAAAEAPAELPAEAPADAPPAE